MNFFFITSIVFAAILNICVSGESCFDMESDAVNELEEKLKNCDNVEGNDDEEKWKETYKCVLTNDQVVEGDDVDIAKFKEWETSFVKNEEKKSLLAKAMDECSGGLEKMDFQKFIDCFEKEEDKICPEDAA